MSKLSIIFRSSRPEVFCKKGILRNFAKITEKHLSQSFFFNKVAGIRPATLLKKRLWHKCFPVNFAKFLKTHFLQNNSGDCFWIFMREPQNCYGAYNFHIDKFHGKSIHSPKIKHTTGRLSNAVLLSYYHGMTGLLETYFVFRSSFQKMEL